MLFALKALTLLFSFLGASYVLFITFIQKSLGSVTKDLGLSAICLSVGLFVSSLIYGRIAAKYQLMKVMSTMLILSSAFLMIFIFLIELYPSVILVLILSFVLGILVAPIIVAANSLFHQNDDNSIMGRVFSNLEVVIHLGLIVFMLLSSKLADIFSSFKVLIFVGIIMFVFSVILRVTIKDEKNLELKLKINK